MLYADLTDSIQVSINDLIIEQKDTFDIVSINGYDYLQIPGAPQLPSKMLRFIIPSDKRVAQIIINNVTEKELNSEIYIYPTQELQNMSAPLNPFTMPDTSIYLHNNNYPQTCFTYQNIGNLKGAKIFSLQFCPIKFNPITKKITLITSINYTLVYENDNSPFITPSKISNGFYSDAKNDLENLIINT